MKQFYINEIPGNQSTKPVKVDKLTPEQEAQRSKSAMLKTCISFYKARLDIETKALNDTVKECNHHVFIDEQLGGPSGEIFRSCAVCDADMGMI